MNDADWHHMKQSTESNHYKVTYESSQGIPYQPGLHDTHKIVCVNKHQVD